MERLHDPLVFPLLFIYEYLYRNFVYEMLYIKKKHIEVLAN